MAIYYIPTLTASDKVVELTEEESKHCIRVLRSKIGDNLVLINGNGLSANARIEDAHPKKCKVIIEKVNVYSPTKEIHLAVCPTKSMDRMEWLIEKGVELGLTRITFLNSKNSERTQIKKERLEKIAISAMKQSKRFFLPEINVLSDIKSFIEEHPGGYIAHCYSGNKISFDIGLKNGPVLIGPEGDFTQEEVAFALNHNYKGLDLGEFRLRTETAALKAIFYLS